MWEKQKALYAKYHNGRNFKQDLIDLCIFAILWNAFIFGTLKLAGWYYG